MRINIFRGISKFQIAPNVKTPWWDVLFHNFNSTKVIAMETSEHNGINRTSKLTITRDEEEFAKFISLEKPENGYVESTTLPSEPAHILKFESSQHGKPATVYRMMIDYQGVHVQTLPSAPFQTIFLSSSRPVSLSENRQRFSNQVNEGKRKNLIDALKIIEPGLEGMELLDFNGETILHGEKGIGRPIPILFMGDGFNRLSSIILAISDAPSGIVLIDEIENGFHYSVLEDVWKVIAKAARDFNVQIFATTHSLETIRAAHQAFSESDTYDFRYHRLDRRKSGQITASSYDQETMQAAVEMDFEIRG